MPCVVYGRGVLLPLLFFRAYSRLLSVATSFFIVKIIITIWGARFKTLVQQLRLYLYLGAALNRW